MPANREGFQDFYVFFLPPPPPLFLIIACEMFPGTALAVVCWELAAAAAAAAGVAGISFRALGFLYLR